MILSGEKISMCNFLNYLLKCVWCIHKNICPGKYIGQLWSPASCPLGPFISPALPATTILPQLSGNLSSGRWRFLKSTTWETWGNWPGSHPAQPGNRLLMFHGATLDKKVRSQWQTLLSAVQRYILLVPPKVLEGLSSICSR